MRELEQARNLYQIFVKDTKAKVLAHAGHGHIWKQTRDDLIPMALYFNIISGIDPLCVNQSVNNLREFGDALNKVVNKTDVPYAVLDNFGKPRVSAYDQKDSYNILVAWPAAKELMGRKDYMLANHKKYMISLTSKDANHLLQIKSLNNADDIPVDQFLVKPGVTQYATALEDGRYQMQLIGKNGMVVWKKNIVVQ